MKVVAILWTSVRDPTRVTLTHFNWLSKSWSKEVEEGALTPVAGRGATIEAKANASVASQVLSSDETFRISRVEKKASSPR